MGTSEILREINRLPVRKRLKIVAQTLKSIQEVEHKSQLEAAAAVLSEDYASDPELTAFTALDLEKIYEAR